MQSTRVRTVEGKESWEGGEPYPSHLTFCLDLDRTRQPLGEGRAWEGGVGWLAGSHPPSHSRRASTVVCWPAGASPPPAFPTSDLELSLPSAIGCSSLP